MIIISENDKFISIIYEKLSTKCINKLRKPRSLALYSSYAQFATPPEPERYLTNNKYVGISAIIKIQAEIIIFYWWVVTINLNTYVLPSS